MTEEMEGLDEVLDELEEVPTAAYETIFPENIGGWSAHKTEHLADKAIENAETEAVKNELVTREKMEEALREAVQGARERERRRIQDKIEKMLEAPNKGASCNGCGWEGHASEVDVETLPSDMGRDEVWKWDCPNCGDQAQPIQLEIGSNLEFLLEELEEEVSEDV